MHECAVSTATLYSTGDFFQSIHTLNALEPFCLFLNACFAILAGQMV